jgi:predicted secreted hydrolase
VRRRAWLLGAAALSALARPARSGATTTAASTDTALATLTAAAPPATTPSTGSGSGSGSGHGHGHGPGAGPDAADDDSAVRRGRALRFPRDHGAHLGATIEWWYVTGWLGSESAPTHGFQITFFRSRTGLAEGNASRFAARHLLFAHAAVTDLAGARHHHAEHLARWSGDPAAAWAGASLSDADVRLAGWSLKRDGEAYLARLPAQPFSIDVRLGRRQPLLLQGDAGFSRKGPEESQASHYYSEPQLAVSGSVTLAGRPAVATPGRAWLDHEWSNELLHPEAVGWDWIGINLFDGSALTAFRLRRRDGSALWAGGSFRPAGGTAAAFAPDAVHFTPGRRWTSPGTAAVYPVSWTIDSPAGRFEVNALLDAQELDSRSSTGTIYWEGLGELLAPGGRRVGLGYLEMTGYAAPLKLG